MNRRVIIIALVAASGCLAWAAGPVQSGIVWLAPADVSRLDDQALAKLSVKEQIAVLVKRLPEQTGRQVTLPGHCDIFETDPAVSRFRGRTLDERGKPRPAITPAGKLFQIGLEAVPQLLDAIDDHRPTRAVGVGPPALDVGDCAMQILQRLSGRSFQPTYDAASDPNDFRAKYRRLAEAWWNDVKGGREAEVLDKDISAGRGEGSPDRLAEIAPDRVVGAIERGLANAAEPSSASYLLTPVVTIDSESSRALMRKMVTQGRFLEVRMTAAGHICQGACNFNGKDVAAYPKEDRRMAREAMLKEWKGIPDLTTGRGYQESSNFAQFLGELAFKEIEALQSISAEMHRHAPYIRAKVIAALGRCLPAASDGSAPPGTVAHFFPALVHNYQWKPVVPDPDRIVEHFLAEQLSDVEYTPEIHPIEGTPPRHRTARVADIAADILHKIRPDRYRFTWDARPDAMEKGRLECLNSWRKSQGLPDEAPAAPVRPAIIEPATVTSINKDSQALSPALKLQVEAWLWKPLNADALAQLLVDFAAEDADDTRTISLTASRVLGKAGVTVEIETRTESQPLADWNSRIDVIVEGKVLMRERANVVLLRATDLWSYPPFKMRVAEALAARPDTALLIQVFRQARPTAKP